MRAGLVATAVLGLGTALVFGAAALTAMLFPGGTMVGAGWNGGWIEGKGGIAVPLPAPVVDDSGAAIEPAPGVTDGSVPVDVGAPDAGGAGDGGTVDGEVVDGGGRVIEDVTPAP